MTPSRTIGAQTKEDVRTGEEPVNFWQLVIRKESFSDLVNNLFFTSFKSRNVKLADTRSIWLGFQFQKETKVNQADISNGVWNNVVVGFSVKI